MMSSEATPPQSTPTATLPPLIPDVGTVHADARTTMSTTDIPLAGVELPFLVDLPDELPVRQNGLPTLGSRLQPRTNISTARRRPRDAAQELLDSLEEDTLSANPLILPLLLPPPMSPSSSRPEETPRFRLQKRRQDQEDRSGLTPPVMAVTDVLGSILFAEAAEATRRSLHQRAPIASTTTDHQQPPTFIIPPSIYLPNVL
ncbi:expressed unknown protein [Seminavis robusta]|uniref:Uncharacterized protein n=1 Tax=Seminavis robusta TaxID=568900 RepID=A0A9N8E9Y6_9STRA|nr:expressed unknown protein [Seminavis robusta]|eukprot:Sro862_g212450.1 n/a (202) ;mRNA; f:20993-21598